MAHCDQYEAMEVPAELLALLCWNNLSLGPTAWLFVYLNCVAQTPEVRKSQPAAKSHRCCAGKALDT